MTAEKAGEVSRVDPMGDSADSRTASAVSVAPATLTPDIDSPLPWRRGTSLSICNVYSAGDSDDLVAQCAIRDDAAYIVTACNSYPALVSALKDLYEDAYCVCEFEDPPCLRCRAGEALKLAEQP